ncbi:MAG TPA: DUF885 domain-containing protein [Candidatus Didemnitutus sp.]|nr:DUF885 domain-containing protein [Candidatus Didemnitutus sp.]
MFFRTLLAPVFALTLAAGAIAANKPDPEFDRWVDDISSAWVRRNPQFATSSQYFTGPEQDAMDRQLTSFTREAREARVALAQRSLDELSRFDRSKLSPQQKISAEMLEWHLKEAAESERFHDFNFVFNQFSGLHVRLVNFLSQTHPIRNRRDVENYLARLGEVEGQIDEGIAQAKDAAGRGFLMPRFIVNSSLGQFERFFAGGPSANVLVTSLQKRMASVKELTEAERAKFASDAQAIVAQNVFPAFHRAEALLQEELPRTNDDAGVWRLPHGDLAYADSLHRLTTTDYTADQIHQIGLKEVTRIEGEMDGLLKQLGYVDGSIKDRMEKLEHDSQPPADPDPRPMLLAQFDGILRDAEKRAALLFDIRPKAPIRVEREPPFTEKTAAAHYTSPAKDGTRPGIFWAPLPGPTYEIAQMRTLVYHEGVPGHHFQIALQQEMEGLPRFRRDGVFGFVSAHGEGWALYAENLAAENGWYEGDIKGHLGQLDAELFRARRLVVDTGIHSMHWTRQQAIDYGIRPAEVERYVVWPGQACSYKMGMLKILEVRAKAKKELGDKFSLKEFHNVVLRAGNVPLPVLEQVVDDYISVIRGK